MAVQKRKGTSIPAPGPTNELFFGPLGDLYTQVLLYFQGFVNII